MRLEDWPKRMNAVIEQYQRIPFKWGESDCGSFADTCVSNMLGRQSVLFPNGKKYTDEQGIKQLVAQNGGMIKWVSAVLGKAPIRPMLAQRGDIVITERALGILDSSCAWFMTESGLKAIPRTKVRLAWRID